MANISLGNVPPALGPIDGGETVKNMINQTIEDANNKKMDEMNLKHNISQFLTIAPAVVGAYLLLK